MGIFSETKKTKKFISFGLSLVIVSFLFFPFLAKAFLEEKILNALLFLPTLFFGVFIGIAILLSGFAARIAGALLDWVTGPNFISYSYTNPENNPVIENGLRVTQSFVNMLLVVVLVYVAVSIALRLGREGEAKKLLVRLILVALLVNFTPVFCGLIVDASNIVMNYFLVGIEDGISGILTQALQYGETVISEAFSFTDSFAKKPAILVQGLIQTVLNLAIAISFLLYTSIFFFRYFAIWILVILSPLAFVSYISPITRNYWNMWLTNFVQWATIGIIKAFFLYLGMSTFGALRKELIAKTELPGVESRVAAHLDNILPFGAVVVFLLMGFAMTFATTAWGSDRVIKLTRKGGKWLGGKTWGGTRRFAGRVLGRRKEWVERQASARFMPERISQMGGVGGALSKFGYGAFVAPTIWALRRGIGEAGLRLSKASIEDIRKTEKRYEGESVERKAADLVSPSRSLTYEKKIGILRKAIDEGQVADMRDQLRRAGRSDQEIDELIIKLGKQAIRIDPEEFKKIRDAFPHLAEEMGREFSDEIRRRLGVSVNQALGEGYSGVAERVTALIKVPDISKMDRTQLVGPNIDNAVKLAILRHWGPAQFAGAVRSFGRTFISDFQQMIDMQGRAWFQTNNPSLLRYLTRSAARGLGLRPPP